MIEPAPKQGTAPHAKATCDECSKSILVACGYKRIKGREQAVPDEGQIRNRLTQQGWKVLRKTIECPECVAKKQGPKPVTEKPTAVPNEPTREQKRAIMDLLEEVYDTDGEHYKSGDTDETVADVLGVMPGWVAKLREEFFGPDGGNEEIADLLGRIEAIEKRIEEDGKHAAALSKRLEEEAEKIAQAKKDLTKIKRAVGPRVLTVAGVR